MSGWFALGSILLFLVVCIGYDASRPTYKITQEYRDDWKQDRFYVYKKIGMPPLTMYSLEIPSYESLEEAKAGVARRKAGAERTVATEN